MNKLFSWLLAFIFSVAVVSGAQAAESIVLDKVAAVVNGEMITLVEVQQNSLAEVTRLGLTGRDAASEAARQKIFREMLDLMIMDTLIKQEAERLKISVSESEVDNEYRMLVQRSNLSREAFDEQLARQGTTVLQVRERLRDNILRQRMVSVMIARKVMISPEEVEKYYNEHKNEFINQKEVEISLIALPPALDAVKIRRQIVAGKISFESAAMKYSAAPNAKEGGRVGVVQWEDLKPNWRSLLAELQVGEVSNILNAGNANLLIRLDSPITREFKELNEVTPIIENILREPRMEDRLKEYTEQLRSKAVVDIRI